MQLVGPPEAKLLWPEKRRIIWLETLFRPTDFGGLGRRRFNNLFLENAFFDPNEVLGAVNLKMSAMVRWLSQILRQQRALSGRIERAD